MAHFASVWSGLLVDGVSAITAAQLTSLDSDHTSSLNGDGGGTWAPSSTVVIGGAGLQFVMPTGVWPGFVAGAITLVRKVPAVPFTKLYSGGSQPGLAGVSFIMGAAAGLVFASRIDTAIPSNATITQVVPIVNIIGTHGSMPTTGPSVSIQRIAKTQAVTYLNSADSGGGLAMTLPTGGGALAAYNALGVTQWNGGSYAANQFNLVDKTQYEFYAQMYDESGGGATGGNMYSGFLVSFSMSDFEPT
jgi:hypothetical protein